jgi:DNA (cytosine-5)-methyltransferase 1
MLRTTYSENNPFAVEWLNSLICHNKIPIGYVDNRSISELSKIDLAGVKVFHAFAGIGGWPLALRMAGWPEDRPVWTGSCPCQPYSKGGSKKGDEDHRNLWPEFRRLISQWNPPTIFGEQVANSDGRQWLARVRTDLEAMGYAVGCADLCAASVGSPHIRQRLYWVGHSRSAGLEGFGTSTGSESQSGSIGEQAWPTSPWGDYDVAVCRDGKSRRIERGTLPVAHGFPKRMGLLHGYGNAIIPPLAAKFIQAFMSL